MRVVLGLALILVGNVEAFVVPRTVTPPSMTRTSLLAVPLANPYYQSTESMGKTVPELLVGSDLIYGYASLRQIVLGHDINYEPDKVKKKNPLIEFDTPALIVTQEGAQRRDRYLKYDVTPQAIQEFIKRNRHYLMEKDGDIVLDPSNTDKEPLDFEKKLDEWLDTKQDVKLTEFDDQFSNEDLVYGITADLTKKRIAVFFRGSVLGNKDWNTDLNGFYTNMPVPPTLKDIPFKEPLKVHRGFYGYLHSPSRRGKVGTKFDTIVKHLREVLSEYPPDYELFISGHSLGGALCQLLAFELAALPESKEEQKIPLPVRAVSFASPRVGNTAFAEAYRELEKAGRLRHLQLSNEGDVVPAAFFGFGYTQTGVNIHVRPPDEKAQVGYAVQHSVFSQIRSDSPKMHGLDYYSERLKNSSNADLLRRSIDEVYGETAGIATLKYTA